MEIKNTLELYQLKTLSNILIFLLMTGLITLFFGIFEKFSSIHLRNKRFFSQLVFFSCSPGIWSLALTDSDSTHVTHLTIVEESLNEDNYISKILLK